MTTYLNKKFCKNGHFAYRYKSNRSCVECRLATSELRSAYRLANRMNKKYTSKTPCKNGHMAAFLLPDDDLHPADAVRPTVFQDAFGRNLVNVGFPVAGCLSLFVHVI